MKRRGCPPAVGTNSFPQTRVRKAIERQEAQKGQTTYDASWSDGGRWRTLDFTHLSLFAWLLDTSMIPNKERCFSIKFRKTGSVLTAARSSVYKMQIGKQILLLDGRIGLFQGFSGDSYTGDTFDIKINGEIEMD